MIDTEHSLFVQNLNNLQQTRCKMFEEYSVSDEVDVEDLFQNMKDEDYLSELFDIFGV